MNESVIIDVKSYGSKDSINMKLIINGFQTANVALTNTEWDVLRHALLNAKQFCIREDYSDPKVLSF